MTLPSWTFDVPRYCPPSQNPYIGPRFREVERLKRSLADLLGVYAILAGVRRVDHAHRVVRHVKLRAVGWAGHTVPDPDNVLKIFLDSCVRAGLIVDDSKEWVKWDSPELVSGEPDCMTVTISDIESRPPVEPQDDPYTRRLLARAGKPRKPKKATTKPDPAARLGQVRATLPVKKGSPPSAKAKKTRGGASPGPAKDAGESRDP